MMINGEVITIYSRYRKGRDESIKRTVLSDCSFFGRIKTAVGDGGLVAGNQYSIRIPIEQLTKYVTPQEWNGANGWSVNAGDVILKGEHSDTPTSLTDITSNNKDVCTVLSVHDNRRGALQHLRIEGK